MSGCIFKIPDGRCDKPGRYLSPCIGEACEYQTPSNYDQLISKTPEELSVYLRSVIDCELCPVIADCDGEVSTPSCYELLLAWLKSPADEEAGE